MPYKNLDESEVHRIVADEMTKILSADPSKEPTKTILENIVGMLAQRLNEEQKRDEKAMYQF